MYDIFSNHKISNLRSYASQEVGNADQTVIDLQEVSDSPGLRERTTKGLIIVDVVSVGTGGTLDLVVKDSMDNVTYDVDFATIDQIDAAGFYAFEIDGINRYFFLDATVGTDAVAWSAVFIGFDAQRRPVKQSDITELTVTYASDRE